MSRARWVRLIVHVYFWSWFWRWAYRPFMMVSHSQFLSLSFGLLHFTCTARRRWCCSSLAGHTGRTQGKSYISFDELGSREVIRTSHAALGENSTLRQSQNAPLPIITEQKIRHSMDDVLGCKSNYTCPEQQQLIQFAVNDDTSTVLAIWPVEWVNLWQFGCM